ncbi:hypothetical protein LZ31DRAFT_86682 [Colletotrichum somersetense]|nr:hypothetical protein LZ31DRAFT_86682 [Colletotrichum somersetense]
MVVMDKISKGSETPRKSNGHWSLLLSLSDTRRLFFIYCLVRQRNRRTASPPQLPRHRPISPDGGRNRLSGEPSPARISHRGPLMRTLSRLLRICDKCARVSALGDCNPAKLASPIKLHPVCSALSNRNAYPASSQIFSRIPSCGTSAGPRAHRIKETVGEHSEIRL